KQRSGESQNIIVGSWGAKVS
nr:RecName: Full=Agglutinin beta-1 chain; AltName: Full=Agglutinin beta-I chain; AltName: Full=Jacalin beta-I chain [Artocarpus tonkinensis]AAB25291.1 jacalin beta-subunit [Artocarpus tonkinensis, seeds, Peptide Partial, 20 aa] [Artocarpus tonkinensis]